MTEQTQTDPPYMNEDISIEERASDLLARLTTKEKYMLLTSHGRRRIYSTKPIKRLSIPSFKVSDGPLGCAFQCSFRKNTRFPATKSLAATWNKQLGWDVGVATAEEVRALGRHMILAPGINIDRTPLNGRTFEYFSEDPFLTKEMAGPFVKGVQSLRVGACLKHFVANNQETDRKTSSSEIHERTLHEIYLRAFRAIVREANPWAVMACYNKVNGVYGIVHTHLVREVLMERWGFNGFVMSDWLATRSIETTEGCINGGLSLEMPWPIRYKIKPLEKAHTEGRFSDEALEDLVRRYIRVLILTGLFDSPESIPRGSRNTTKHQSLSRRVAEEGMVLLKNEQSLLPLDILSIDSIALLGPNLKKKFGKFLYGGSSAVIPPYEITPLKGMKERCKDKVRIVSDPSRSDVAIIFAGLNHGKGMDSEFGDRDSLGLPEKQVQLINETVAVNPNTIVVLISGSPVSMDGWLENVPVVLEAWYPGMEGGRAIVNVLFGDVNPSGKLPLTFPRKLGDSPAHSTGLRKNYPGDEEKRVFYDEGIFVGYRWFEKKGINPLFPFGFGQSYTSFEYENVHLERESISTPEDVFTIEIDIVNVGERAGSEVIQAYSRDIESSVERPQKELVGFEKLRLDSGERRTASLCIKAEDLGFYDVTIHDWVVEPGEFEIQIGRSSVDIEARTRITYQ